MNHGYSSLPASQAGGIYHAARAFGLLFALVGCGDPEPAPDGSAPPRVISCSPEVTRLLVEFGIGHSIVATDTLSRGEPGLDPASPDLGPGCGEASPGALPPAGLAIFLGDDGSADVAGRLRAAGLDVLVLEPRRMNDVVATHFRLEAALGLSGRAVPSTSRLTSAIASIATRRDGRFRLRIVWVLARDPLVVVGNDGMLHEILELAGAENGFHGQSAARLTTTPAEIAATAPDLVLDSGALGPPLDLPAGVRLRRAPPDLATLPALDVMPRVRGLHLLLYPETGPGL